MPPTSSVGDVIVLELGAAHGIVGFAHEAHYRFIFDTPLCMDYTAHTPMSIRGQEEQPRSQQHGDSYLKTKQRGYQRALVAWLRYIFLDMLSIRPQEYKILVVLEESAPRHIVLALLQMCIHEFNMKGAQLVSAATAIVAVTGLTSGLIVDVGYRETRIIPVYEGSVAPENIERIPCGSLDCKRNVGRVSNGHKLLQKGTCTDDDLFRSFERAHQSRYACCLLESSDSRGILAHTMNVSTEIDHLGLDKLGTAIGSAIQSTLRKHPTFELRRILHRTVVSGWLCSHTECLRVIEENIYSAAFEYGCVKADDVHLSTGISPFANAYYGAVILCRAGCTPVPLFTHANVPMPEYHDPTTWREGVAEFTRSHCVRICCEHQLNPLDDSGTVSLSDLLYRRQV